MIRPWAVRSPSACTSVMKQAACEVLAAAGDAELSACLIELMVVAARIGEPMILAWRTAPVAGTTRNRCPEMDDAPGEDLAPFLVTTAAVSRSSASPKA